MHERIFVAQTRATAEAFPRMLTELVAAASREDAPAALAHLRELVPSFVPDQIHDQPAALAEVAAG